MFITYCVACCLFRSLQGKDYSQGVRSSFFMGCKKSFIKDKSLKVHVGVHSNITWMVLDFIMIHAGSNRSATSVAGDNMPQLLVWYRDVGMSKILTGTTGQQKGVNNCDLSSPIFGRCRSKNFSFKLNRYFLFRYKFKEIFVICTMSAFQRIFKI